MVRTLMKPRPEVRRFARVMERKLRKNDHKRHWSKCDEEYLLRSLRNEMEELFDACEGGESDRAVESECADVANFAMMIADNRRSGRRRVV